MNIPWKTIIWHQFGATIDTLDEVVRACPDDLWHARLWDNLSERPEYSQIWYRVYHTLFWLDLYLFGAEEGFVPPAPFALIEMEEDDIPERAYTKDELLAYLQHGRRRCKATIEALTDESAQRIHRFPWGELTFVELLLYNMRHVQDHASQLSLLLGQKGVPVRDWVITARDTAA
jgi:hypothetical protein